MAGEIDNNFQDGIMSLVNGLTGAELVEMSNVIFTKSFEVSKISDQFTITTGVREGNVIPIMSTAPKYDSFPYKNPQDCTIPVCDLNLEFSAKVWQLGMIACTIPICLNTFDEDFLKFWNVYRKVVQDEADLDTALLEYLIERFNKNLDAAIWRVVWFGERGIASTDQNYDLLRPIDGIFTQAEAGDGIKITIAANTTGTMTGEELYALFQTMYNAASATDWFDDETTEFKVTKKVATVWVTWLNNLEDYSQYNCECVSVDGVTKKNSFRVTDNLYVMGIPIKVYPELDGVIRALNLGRPYRILLTYRDNILVGTSEASQFPKFEAWYERKDNMIYLRGGAAIAAALVTDEYVYAGAEAASVVPVEFVSVSPQTATASQGGTSTFTKVVQPSTAPQGVTWTVTKLDGTAQAGLAVNGSGVVTIGGSVPVGTYLVKATSVGDTSYHDNATLTVTV